MPRPLLLGHRGARAVKNIPENTLASFDFALQHGCDGFEFDVRLTGDDECLICHDPNVGGIDIASAKRADLADNPTLKEVLDRYAGKAFLDIELKVAGMEGRVAKLISEYSFPRGFVVSSFFPEVLVALHRRKGDLPLGLICETRAELGRWSSLPITHVIPHYKLISAETTRSWHASGKNVLAWTVNSAEQMRQLQEWNVDAIISDETELLVRTLR
jgi:glycerophosphoryl diester phosphodiesterase